MGVGARRRLNGEANGGSNGGSRGGSLPGILARQAAVYRAETAFHSGAFLHVLDMGLLLIVALWVAFLATAVFTMYIHSIETLDYILRW